MRSLLCFKIWQGLFWCSEDFTRSVFVVLKIWGGLFWCAEDLVRSVLVCWRFDEICFSVLKIWWGLFWCATDERHCGLWHPTPRRHLPAQHAGVWPAQASRQVSPHSVFISSWLLCWASPHSVFISSWLLCWISPHSVFISSCWTSPQESKQIQSIMPGCVEMFHAL